MELKDRVVLVTGAAGGIGSALCRRFREEGVGGLVVSDLDLEATEQVASEVGGIAVQADVSQEGDVKHLVGRAQLEFGRVDVYCSNAGIAYGGGPEAPDEEWETSWRVHVMAHVYAARAVLPGMVERGMGYFLGTISAAGLLNHVFAAPYAVTKYAGLGLMEWLAIAHGGDGVRVSALCPQGVRTAMLAQDRVPALLQPTAIEPEVVAESVVRGIEAEKFLILPHPEVEEYFRRKGNDYDRWLNGMRKLRTRVLEQT